MGVVWEGTCEGGVQQGEDDVDEVRVGVQLVAQRLDYVIGAVRHRVCGLGQRGKFCRSSGGRG